MKGQFNSTFRSTFNSSKYRPVAPVDISDRTWPDQQITQAPLWCSVDLRDGNQALIEPMTVDQKTRMWQMLVNMGFKEIEVGFPAASKPDFDFVRKIIEEGLIPEDVTIQVLVQAREHLIARTFEALQGVKQAIVHVYNSTSKVQREKVFQLDKDGIKSIAVKGATWVQQYAHQHPQTQWTFQYSPESFTGTELAVSAEICNSVIDVWQPTTDHKCIINLPATVEVSTPNHFADQIEWMCRNLHRRDSVVVSVHTHNDRGTGVAATELALMAGADRVEGTLMGNGERTGNLDIVTTALNMYSQGVDPKLDFSAMEDIVSTYQHCNQLEVHPRHPYVGDLVFTAFSGSHQDAIRKCLKTYQQDQPWEIAYLPIDPKDLGRNYEEVIRINSQSGKGGVAYVMEQDHGFRLPRSLQMDFSGVIQSLSEQTQTEVSSEAIWNAFQATYMLSNRPYTLKEYSIQRDQSKQEDNVKAVVTADGQSMILSGQGRGPIAAFVSGLKECQNIDFDLVDYGEHAIGSGADAKAVAYIQIQVGDQAYFGVGCDDDIVMASLYAVLRAVNNAVNRGAVVRGSSKNKLAV